MSIILDPLNEAQEQVVSAPLRNQLVLAGAGSGKTRVLVHRIAWLIQQENVYPSSILAVTFTNKAANEMRGRIETLLENPAQGMWIGTFHSLAHKLLRLHWREAQLAENFQVLDAEDQYRLIRRITRELNLDENQWSPKQTQWFINGQKDVGHRPQAIKPQNDLYLKTLLKIYEAYEMACKTANLVDFAELLLRAYELWRDHSPLTQHYRQRFKHLLVDEFQDTNAIQYQWLKLILHAENHFTIVGDDDQSIYGWRGARIENIQQVLQDFPQTQIIRLEQNYRSTRTILAAANALIANNLGRMGKNLWTAGQSGEPIQLYQAFNELDEARYIVGIIKKWLENGNRRDEVAILYRSNAQSRVLEEALIEAGIPYRIYGGLRFFERAEIKDALAYLRLMQNPHDDAAFERVVNTPTRGIGSTTLNLLREYAKLQQISLWQAAEKYLTSDELTPRAKNALNKFLDLIILMAKDSHALEPGLMVEHMLRTSSLLEHYLKEKGEKGRARVENLEELISAARQFRPEDNAMPLMQAFLAHASLEAGETQAQAFEDSVQMMTLHSAKGLEFPLVIMSGMEEGLFPHQMSLEEPGRLEEERRLCYVGITRAMQQLYFTYAETRRLHGSEAHHRPSRFMREIPRELLKEIRLKSRVTTPPTLTVKPISNINLNVGELPGFNIGDNVTHPKFGDGVVISYEGSGANAHVHVKFNRAGDKRIIARFLTAL